MSSESVTAGLSLAGLPVEITCLMVAVVFAFVHIFAAASAITSERGVKWNAGPRDEQMPAPGPLAGRLDRASKNFLETFPLFAVAVLAAVVTGRTSGTTALGAELYLAGRILFLPIYAAGWPYVRSLVWVGSLAGIVMIIVGVFTPA